MYRTHHRVALTGIAALVVLSAACRGTGRLGEYDFTDTTLAARSLVPPHPEVLTGPWFFDWSSDPVRSVLRAGAQIAKEHEASHIRARLDSATATVDLDGRLRSRALERVTFYLRSRPLEDESQADYLLEVVIRKYGIDAEDWEAAAHFFVDARVTLLDARTGTRIWDTDVTTRNRIQPVVIAPEAIRDVVTARALASQSVPEIARTLERLADYSADRITERLRSALEKVRNERTR